MRAEIVGRVDRLANAALDALLALSSLSKFVTRASVVSIRPAMLAALRQGRCERPSPGR